MSALRWHASTTSLSQSTSFQHLLDGRHFQTHPEQLITPSFDALGIGSREVSVNSRRPKAPSMVNFVKPSSSLQCEMLWIFLRERWGHWRLDHYYSSATLWIKRTSESPRIQLWLIIPSHRSIGTTVKSPGFSSSPVIDFRYTTYVLGFCVYNFL